MAQMTLLKNGPIELLIPMSETLIKIADAINTKRRKEILDIYSNKSIFDNLLAIRSSNVYNKGNKSKSMRKVASMPIEVDNFFTKIYGVDYYKDKDFFTKHYPEWAVVSAMNI